jgi:putative MATE family efflux protein
VLSIYSTDPEVIRLGAGYLRIFSWTYIFFAILFSYALILRSIGEVKAPVTISIISLLLNAALAYALIFGKFGLPQLGINGAAWATVISRALECIVLIYYTYNHSNSPAAAKLSDLFGFDRAFIVHVMKPVLPVTVNEILWSVGITSYSAIYARMGTESIAAVNIVGTIDMMAFILFWAMNGANSVLVGNAIGAGDEETAQKYAARSLLLVVVGAALMGALAYFSADLVLSLYKVSPQVIENTRHILAFSCGLFWLRAMNGFLLVAILRSGGDTQFALVLDGIIIWIVGVPLAWLGAFVFHFPVELVFLCAMSEEAAKGALGVWRFFSRKWIHNLTHAVES